MENNNQRDFIFLKDDQGNTVSKENYGLSSMVKMVFSSHYSSFLLSSFSFFPVFHFSLFLFLLSDVFYFFLQLFL